MTKEEGLKAGVKNPRYFFRCVDGKGNLTPPPEAADWFQFLSIPLGNKDAGLVDNGDKVGVVEPWTFPDMLAGVTGDHATAVFAKMRGGEYRADPQAGAWVGIVVAKVMGLNLTVPHDKAKVNHIVKTWIACGSLVRVERKDKKGELRWFVQVADTDDD
jgi:hypothetical protein